MSADDAGNLVALIFITIMGLTLGKASVDVMLEAVAARRKAERALRSGEGTIL